jgi:hypothetical protein
MIQILDGIEEGELMITEVTTEMEEGMAVTPVSVE